MVCEVAEGTVHRLWEPLADKQQSGQRLRRQVLHALLHRRGLRARQCRAGRLHRCRGAKTRRCSVLPPRSVTSSTPTIRIRRITPATSARCCATARVIEERQPYMRGGAHEPLTRQDIEDKFILNARHGGWPETAIASALERARTIYDGPLNLLALRESSSP